MHTVNNAPNAPKPVGAYSQAMVHQGVVYLAGQIGLDPRTSELAAGGIEAETRQVLSNLRAVLQASGSSAEQILMSTIFLADIADAPVVNRLYSEFVSASNPPARQTVSVKALPLGARIEISLVAAKS